jgi:HAE1 family hydrophobic/amphiphilic exporter-1
MIRYFTTHPTAANILMAVFLVLGVVALPSLLRETFPRMEPRTVQITVANPGATSGEVARSICRPIEEALEGIENLDEVVCVARESLALSAGGDAARCRFRSVRHRC